MPLSGPDSGGFIRGPGGSPTGLDDDVRIPKWWNTADSRGAALDSTKARVTVTTKYTRRLKRPRLRRGWR